MGLGKVPVLPNVITAFSLTCGLFVIFKINMIPPGEMTLNVLLITTGILLLAAFADFMDGAVARLLKAESTFGGLFDSLADAITFGVAPSIIVLKSMSVAKGTPFSFLISAAAMIYSVSGVLRLVRFNVMALQAKDNPEMVEDASGKKNFTGLPIPAAAAAIISLNLFLFSDELYSLFGDVSMAAKRWIIIAAMIIVGYFMISRWKFLSFKALRIKVASFQMVFLTVVTAAFLFYGLLNHFPLTFLVGSWGYLAIAWILSIVRVIAGRRSKALEDFEPEPEEEEIN